MTVTWKMANTQTNPIPSTNYDYSQYPGYQYETGSYNTTVPVTTATTAPAYNYGYDYSQAGYSGYNTYSGQYGYGQGYDYSNYPGYYTTTSTTPTVVQSAVSTGAVIPSGETQVSASSSYGSSGSTLNPPPVPTVPATSNASTWGGYYNTVPNTGTGGYSQPQTGYGTTPSTSSAPSQIQSTAGSQQSWNQQGYGSQTNVGEGAGNIQTYQTQTPTYGSQSQNSQYQGDYRKQTYNTVEYDNSSQNPSYYSGVQNTTGYNNEPKSFGNSRGWGDRGRENFNKNVGRGATYGSNGRGAYNDQKKGERKDPCDEYDARNYRDNSMNRNDRGRGGGRGGGRGRGFFSRGRGNEGSGFPGLKGQWSDDNNRDNTYGQRSTNDDNRGGRGSFRGSGRGRGNVFNSDKLGYDMDNNVNRPDSDSGKRGGGYGGRGGYGRGDNHDRNRGGFRGGYDGGRGQSRGGFSRGGGRGERGGARGGQSQSLQESVVGRGRGSVSESSDSKEPLDGEPNVANDLPWTNTTAPSAELKRKQEPLVTIAAKKKKEEEIVDVMPFIQAHIEEHCTVNEDARKLAEESLKKMMQPGYCVLCNARMSGTPQAKMHYQGKNHNKKIKNFITGGMTKYAEKVKEDANKTEEQIEKERMEEEEKNRLLDQQVEEGARRVRENLLHLSSVDAHNIPDMETRPSSTGNQTSIVDTQNPDFCHLCTVEFSSAQQAEQHYQGKNHKKRLKHIGPGAEELGQFVCETCNVRVTTQEILNQHFNGAKHKAKASREVESKDYIVPEGGLVVEGGPRLRPGQRVPAGFKVMPYKEPTKNEGFTTSFEGPASFFSDSPTPIPPPTQAETPSKKKRNKSNRITPNVYAII